MNHFQSDDAVNPDRLYDLMAVVIHCGSGPNRGHYISIVKSHGFWLLFDDDMVDVCITKLKKENNMSEWFLLFTNCRKLKRQQLRIFMGLHLTYKSHQRPDIFYFINPVTVRREKSSFSSCASFYK